MEILKKNEEIEEVKVDALDASAVNDLEINKIREIYKNSNDEFKKYVDGINEKKELDKLEESLMDVMNEHDKYIREVKYSLPEEVTFEDEHFSRSKISTRIKSLLEKHEVEFTYIYGLYNLCKFWAGNPSEIEYGPLDSTLRLLEQLKYTGKDWRTMMIINAFFNKSNDEYNKDLTRTIFLAERHNIIIEKMQLLSPVKENE